MYVNLLLRFSYSSIGIDLGNEQINSHLCIIVDGLTSMVNVVEGK